MSTEMAAGAEIPPSDAILFILVAFGIGIFIRMFLKWTKIPYTAMLLLVGLAIGFLQLANPATYAFTNTLKLWLSMEPHLLLLIFLPIIGFSAAIGQEPHMLRKSWGQIMVLAWPGVVIQFLLIAMCAKWFFPYNWTWPEAFLFGAMLSATDPVAVVAVLQEVGASQKLACVIDGESLMNDGSALVIFLLLQKIVEGEHVTVGGAVAQFCLLAVVGMLLGVAFGGATSWLLDNIFRDPTLTTVVTLVSAYSSYYTADRLVGASGLLAVVCNGFTMSLIGGRQITMRVEDAMHGFWSVLEWGANTILFVWMGIVLAIVLPPSHEQTAITDQPIHLEPRDAGYVVVLYLWLQVARAVLLLVCWIPFNYTGYPLTWRSAVVMVWGGLRGAVGMVMALFIFLDTKIHDDSFKSYCIFYMGTMAFFTVVINGGTTKAVLSWLGFMSYTPEQLGTLQHVIEDMEEMRGKRLRELRPDEVLGEPEPDVVKVWSRLPTDEVLAQAAAKMVRPALNTSSPAYQSALAAGMDPELLYDYRCRVLHMVKAHYADVYDQHLLGTLQVRTLQAVTDAALDEAGEGLTDWRLLEPSCKPRGLPRLMQAWQLHKVSTTLVQATTYSHSLSNLQLLVGFIHAHRHAQEHLRQHIGAVVGDLSGLDQAGGLSGLGQAASGKADHLHPLAPASPCHMESAGNSLEGLRGGAEALAVLKESEAEAVQALVLAEGITRSHPSLPAWLRSKQAAGEILTEQHVFLQHLADAGLVQPREMLLLGDLMHEQFKALLQANTGLAAAFQYSRTRPPLNVLPLFDSLSDAEVQQLMAHVGKEAEKQDSSVPGIATGLSWKVYYPEQLIAGLGSPRIDHVVVISKGSVRMRFPVVDGPHGRTEEHTVVASVGDPLGVCELMLGLPRMSELTADSMVQALLVPTPTFLRLVAAVPGIQQRAWQATAAQLAGQHHHILGQHRQLAPLNMFFRMCSVERIAPGQVLEVPRTALLLTGQVKALLPLPADFHSPRSRSSSDGAPWSLLPRGGSGSSSSSSNLAAAGAAGGLNGDSPRSSISNSLCDRAMLQQELHSGSGPAAVPVPAGSEDEQSDPTVLAAPAELPPGEFKCLTESMVLQVPRGSELPSSLETTTYQAQVLSKGSIPLMPRSSSQGGVSGGTGGGAAAGDDASLSSPLRGVLAKVSRMAGLGRISRTASDSVPVMPFLQKALASMRTEQQQQQQGAAGVWAGSSSSRLAAGGPAGSAAAAAAGGGAGGLNGNRGFLHTVSEGVHRESLPSGDPTSRVGGEGESLPSNPATAAAPAAPPAAGLADIEMGAASGGSANGIASAGSSSRLSFSASAAAQVPAAALPRATDIVHKQRSFGFGRRRGSSRESGDAHHAHSPATLRGSASGQPSEIGKLSSSSLTRRSGSSLS